MYLNNKLSHLLSPVNGEGGGVLPDAQRPEPFTLESLIAWLRTKDAAATYDFTDTCSRRGGCIFAQYGAAHGFEPTFQGYLSTIRRFQPDDPYTCQDPFVEGHISGEFPHTFGAALERALAYQAGAK